VFIGKVCRYNHRNNYYDLSEFYQNVDQNNLNKEQKSLLVIKEIEALLDLAKIPKDLDTFGVTNSSYKGFIKFASEAMEAFNFNPIKVDPEEVPEIFIKN